MKLLTQFNEGRDLRICKIATLFVVAFLCVSGFFSHSSAYAAGERITVTVAPSISLDLLPIYPSGTFMTSSTSDTVVSVATNNYTGYTLGISASVANSNALVNSSDNTMILPSITSAVSEESYRSSAELNNTWGYRPSTIYNTITGETEQNDNYLQAPSSADVPIILDVTKSSNTEANNYNIAIGVRSDANTTPGVYENTFVIIATANPISYTISYYKNTEDPVTGMPASVDVFGSTYEIDGSPNRNGYEFLGWCSTQTITVDGVDNCNGTIYSPGSLYVPDYTRADNDIWLYAMWSKIYAIEYINYMQEFKTFSQTNLNSVKNSMVENQQYQLKDSRDEKEYYVAKLPDGNIWMTQNLDHDIVTDTDFYTPDNTDIPANWTAGLATHVTGDTTWAKSNTTLESYDPGDLCWDSSFPSAPVSCSQNDLSHYHLGNYYNWTAAIAMNDSSSYTSSSQSIDQSICPAGWTLPNRSGSLSFRNLIGNTDLNLAAGGASGNVQNNPVYFGYGGYWNNGAIGSFSRYGYWWTGNIYGSSQVYIFQIDANIATLTYNNRGERYQGNSVRCIAR